MLIQLNGEDRQFDGEPTLTQLIDTLGLTGRRIAIEVNEEIVPRSLHAQTRLNDGDCIEIVHAIGGG